MLSLDERQRLLTLARKSFEAHVRREQPPPIERGGALDDRCSAFVTIHHAGTLRGCLGQIDAAMSLGDAIAHLAAVVSDSDPRFPPVALQELDRISLEISVLTPERDVTNVDEIEVGRHGLIIEQGHRRGLLLPQVATEFGWDRTTFVEQTCVKAGLPRDAWRHGARILCFEAEVFGEEP